MKIRNKILIFSLAVTFFVMIIVMADSFYNVDSNIVNNAESKLEAIASIQENRINSEIENHKIQAGLVSSRTSLTDDVVNYDLTHDKKYVASLKTRLLDVISAAPDFKAVYVLADDGSIITGTDTVDPLGRLTGGELTNAKTDRQVFVYESSTAIKDLALTSPISRDGKYAGIVLIITASDALQKIMTDYSGLGETGETIIAVKNINGDAEYIQPPRFADQNSSLVISKDKRTVAANVALNKVEGLSKNNINYRDHAIYSVTRYIESVGWGVVVQVDKAEIYQPVYSHAIQLGSIAVLLIIIMLFVSFKLANSIARPLETLRTNADIIAKGDLNLDVVVRSRDEIGELSRSFSQMMKAIIASRASVDQQVMDQTKEIVEKEAYMHDEQKAIINILEDVEEEKENTKREKDRINTILQSIGDAVFVVDQNLKIQLVNQVTIDLSGYSEDELVGKKYTDVLRFIHEDANSKVEIVNDKFVNDAISTGKVQEMSNHTVIVCKDKKRIPVSDSSAPLKNQAGEIIGCVVVFRDVTREYEIDKAKTEFVSLASHQLRTPLSAIGWYSEMLADGDAGKLNEKQQQYLLEITKGNKRMVELVNSLLNVSRLELGTFVVDPVPTNIVTIAEESVKELVALLDEKKLKIEEDYGKEIPMINLDPKLTRIIFQNLLSNAVKYTPKGKVSISVSRSDGSVVIKVADTGLGIPHHQQKRMFEKLFRADNVRVSNVEGTGLGLYIVKTVIDNVGGSIRFESKENVGTTFYVKLPLTGMKKKEGSRTLDQTE
ncbi:MAG: ATP-binding protein [Candidatus Berkelbacteria bacterium]